MSITFNNTEFEEEDFLQAYVEQKRKENDVKEVRVEMEKVLLEFPMSSFNINLPKWMQSLPADHKIISSIRPNQ